MKNLQKSIAAVANFVIQYFKWNSRQHTKFESHLRRNEYRSSQSSKLGQICGFQQFS